MSAPFSLPCGVAFSYMTDVLAWAPHLRAGVAIKDSHSSEHLQHDHAKAVHIARARHAPVMQHLHGLVGHCACMRHLASAPSLPSTRLLVAQYHPARRLHSLPKQDKGAGIVLRAVRESQPQRGRYSELMVLSMCQFGGRSLCAKTACASLSDCHSLYALLLTQDHKRRPTMSAGRDMGAIGAQDTRQAKVCKLADIAARVLFRRPHAFDQHIGALQITAQAKTLLSFLSKLTPQSRSLWGSEGRSQAAAHS